VAEEAAVLKPGPEIIKLTPTATQTKSVARILMVTGRRVSAKGFSGATIMTFTKANYGGFAQLAFWWRRAVWNQDPELQSGPALRGSWRKGRARNSLVCLV
jgi:hypothetical protein